MNNILKKGLLWGSVAGIVGLLLCFGVLFALDFDLTRLDTAGTNSGTLDLVETYAPDALSAVCHIDIDGASCDVTVRPDPNGKFRVEYDVPGYVDVTATVDGNRLVVTGLDTSARQPWYKRIYLHLREHTGITVYVPMIYSPAASYGALNIRTTSGDIALLPGLTAERADITSKSGDMDIRINVKGSLTLENGSGDVKLSASTANRLSVTTDSGDMKLSYVSVTGHADLQTDSGNLDATCTEAAYFTADTVSGDIELKKSGGTILMGMQTTSGDVEVEAIESYDLYTSSTSGEIHVKGHRQVSYHLSNCTIFTDSGNITVR